MAAIKCSLSIAMPAAMPFRKTQANKPRSQRRTLAPRASAMEVFRLAEEAAPAVGSVAAPAWVLPVGVIVVTLGSILSGYLLKPGADAAEDIKKRDARSGRFK